MENKSQTRMRDNKKIGADENNELAYWSNEFGISRDELIKEAKAGRTFAEAVEKFVKKVKFAV